jgi:hypothetical protein
VKLADLRRLAIKKQVKIHYRLGSGLECIVSEHGVAHVPALKSVPDFNLEDELAAASEFLIEPVGMPSRRVGREELAAMAGDTGVPAAAHEHEDE